jgi:hypothetical protein
MHAWLRRRVRRWLFAPGTWLTLHVVMASLGLSAAIGGFAVAVTAFELPRTSWHKGLGWGALVLAILQPVNALVRPAPGRGTRRRLWEALHKVTGAAAVALGIWNCHLGLALGYPPFAAYERAWRAVLLALLGAGAALAALAVLLAVHSRRGRAPDYRMQLAAPHAHASP